MAVDGGKMRDITTNMTLTDGTTTIEVTGTVELEPSATDGWALMWTGLEWRDGAWRTGPLRLQYLTTHIEVS